MDLQYFRGVAFLEGLSLILLFFVAMPLKYMAGKPEAVRVVGMIHGILFLMYVAILLKVAVQHRWPAKQAVLGFIASSIPFGTFWFDRRYLRARSSAV